MQRGLGFTRRKTTLLFLALEVAETALLWRSGSGPSEQRRGALANAVLCSCALCKHVRSYYVLRLSCRLQVKCLQRLLGGFLS